MFRKHKARMRIVLLLLLFLCPGRGVPLVGMAGDLQVAEEANSRART